MGITPRRRTERRRSAQRRAPKEAPRRAAGTAAPQRAPRPPALRLTSSALSSSIAFLLMVNAKGGRAPSSAPPTGSSAERSPAASAPHKGIAGAASPRPPAADPSAAPGPPPAARPRLGSARLPPRPVRSRLPRAVRPPALLGLSSRPRRGRCPAQRLFIKTRGRQRRPSWGWVT